MKDTIDQATQNDYGEILETFNKWLEVTLTDAERLERADQSSQAFKEREDVEAEKAEANRLFGEKLKKLSGEIGSLQNKIRTGKEHRNVPCRTEKIIVTGEIITRRLDNMELVDRRPMRPDEKQEHLPLGEDETPFVPFDLSGEPDKPDTSGRVESWGVDRAAGKDE